MTENGFGLVETERRPRQDANKPHRRARPETVKPSHNEQRRGNPGRRGGKQHQRLPETGENVHTEEVERRGHVELGCGV